jgi:tetratricopeptide (TPR) repeat protein
VNQPAFQRVRELFLEALAAPPDVREAMLQQRCRGDERLFAEVSSLLANHQDADDFLAEPALGAQFSVADAFVAGERRTLGPYRLQALLGAGGHGLVYRAEHLETGQVVALKVQRHSSGTTDDGAERLGHEAELLRQLRHPAIAACHGVGTAEQDGETLAWLAMELVPGQPIDRFVQQNDVGVRHVVALVVEVANAVQFAHDLGITHNDLSPANVLVTAEGHPKVVDFGLASGPQAPFRGATAGTPGFLAPETKRAATARQPAATPRPTTGQDVYALGALLYQLLSGRTVDERARLWPEERDDEPWPLEALRPELRGDLCTVVHHALVADPQRRCSSAGQFAADLQRWLRGEPVLAPRPTTWQRARRFAGKHRALVGSLLATFCVLVAGVTSTSLALNAARRARADEQQQRLLAEARLHEAEGARRRAEAVGDYLTGLLRSAAEAPDGERPSLETVLVGAAEQLAAALPDGGSLQSGMCQALGLSLYALGRFELAERQVQRAVELARRESPLDEARHLSLQIDIAVARLHAGRPADALALLQPLRDRLRNADEFASNLRLRCLHNHALATFELAGARAARPLVDEMLRLTETMPANESALEARTVAGRIWSAEGDHRGAIAILEPALQDALAHLPAHHPQSLTLLNNLGLEYLKVGERHRGGELLETAAAGRRLRFGEAHPETLQSLHNLASLRADQDRHEEALALLQQVVDGRSRSIGPNHPKTLVSKNNLARQLESRGDSKAAETLLREVVAAAEAALPSGREQLLVYRYNLARLLLATHRPADALPLVQECLVDAEALRGADHAVTRELATKLAQVRRDVERRSRPLPK